MSCYGASLRSDENGMRKTRRWLACCGLIVLAGALISVVPVRLSASPPPQQRQGSDLSAGCEPDRPVIAHHVGGVTVTSPTGKEATPPIPCVVRTGYRVGEESIVVTNAGTVLLRPAWETDAVGPTSGAIRSDDQGANWETPLVAANDTNMWVDRKTGRVFWMTSGSGNLKTPRSPLLMISDDDGKTWNAGGQSHIAADHVQVFGGPPTTSMKNFLKGYPNVVYACMGHKGLKCEKSQDGGMTWGPELDIPYPPGLEALQGSAQDCSAFGLQGVVDKDGTVIVPYNPCNRPYVAITHDEGGTWQLVAVAKTDTIGYGYPSLGIDEQQNLYAAWVGASDRLLYLAISRDHGLHWGTPMMIGAPGVNETAIPYLVSGGRGHVAVSYYASKNATVPFPVTCFAYEPQNPPRQRFPTLNCPGYEDETWNTYVTETWNALDEEPLFWSTTLNDPAQPTWYGCSPSEIGVIRHLGDKGEGVAGPGYYRGCYPGLVLDYYGATMASDGTVWVGFAQECPYGRRASGNPNCPGTGDGGLFGLVGHLAPRRNETAAKR